MPIDVLEVFWTCNVTIGYDLLPRHSEMHERTDQRINTYFQNRTRRSGPGDIVTKHPLVCGLRSLCSRIFLWSFAAYSSGFDGLDEKKINARRQVDRGPSPGNSQAPSPRLAPPLIFNTPPSFFCWGLCWGSPHLRDSDG